MANHWLLVGSLALFWVGSLILMRLWTRRQVIKELLQPGANGEDLARAFPDPGPADRAALEVIRAFRNGYLWKRWPETDLTFKAFNEMSLELIKKIAGVYYPDEGQPELKASLADLVALHNRVGTRLAAWLESLPMRPFKDVELKTVLRYHEVYRNVRSHPAYTFMKRHRLDTVARWGWAAFNFNSPFYWSRRAAYELGRRLLLAHTVALVGEEAMLLYSRRSEAGGR